MNRKPNFVKIVQTKISNGEGTSAIVSWLKSEGLSVGECVQTIRLALQISLSDAAEIVFSTESCSGAKEAHEALMSDVFSMFQASSDIVFENEKESTEADQSDGVGSKKSDD